MKTSLIFDLDGTLWDATKPIFDAWKNVGEKYFGPDYSLGLSQVKSMMGKTMEEIGKMLTPVGADPVISAAFVKECFDCETVYLSEHPGALFPFELETLYELSQRFDLYIVSNCQLGYIECFLRIVPTSLFRGHLCWGDTRLDKQFTIRVLMEKYGIEHAIYVGDTEKDENACLAARVPFIHAAYGFGTAKKPDAVANDFTEIGLAANKICQSLD